MKSTMKNLISILLFTSLTLPLLSQSDNSGKGREQFYYFQRQIDDWKNAYNSGDAQNLVHLYTEDAQYISGHVNGLVADGRDNLIKNFQNGIKAGGHIDSIIVLKMDVSKDLATLLCKYQATNSGVTVVGRNLLVLRKVKKDWYIFLHMTVV
jgi:ketosteroid isomerase-like protein